MDKGPLKGWNLGFDGDWAANKLDEMRSYSKYTEWTMRYNS